MMSPLNHQGLLTGTAGTTLPNLIRCSCLFVRRPLLKRPAFVCNAVSSKEGTCTRSKVLGKVLAAVAAGWLCTGQPAWAELQTVAPQTVTQLARPLPQQQVKKGRVWLIFLLGATSLFGAAVVLENNAALFPAIHRANQAMAANKKAQQKRQDEDQLIEMEQVQEERSQDAVLDGLAEARVKAGITADTQAESSTTVAKLTDDQIRDEIHKKSQQSTSSQPDATEERETSIASTSSQRQ